jgi:hypothetical protein
MKQIATSIAALVALVLSIAALLGVAAAIAVRMFLIVRGL